MSINQYFTEEHVAKNNGLGNSRAWIIIKNSIYDITDYLKEHPGGGELLLEYGGKDATAVFEDFGHSSDAKNTLKSLKIGEVIQEDKSANKSKFKRPSKEKESKMTSNETRRNRRPFLRVVCGGCV